MSEQTYNKVFQLIQESLVPKSQLDEYQTKILHLESMVEKANTEVDKLKSEFSEQKLSLEITQAEKESLQAEKKAIEVKFNEVSLKLKQKTHQYDSLLKSQDGQDRTEKLPAQSIVTPNVKQEPIGNVPVSLPSKPNAAEPQTKPKTPNNRPKSNRMDSKNCIIFTTWAKRHNASEDDSPRAKRAKVEKTNNQSRDTSKSTSSKKLPLYRFNCIECLHDWGNDIECNFKGDPDQNLAPDPKLKIPIFKSTVDYDQHLWDTHRCELLPEHRLSHKFRCDTKFGCGFHFETKAILDKHIEFEHADLEGYLTRRQYFDLHLKYKDV